MSHESNPAIRAQVSGNKEGHQVPGEATLEVDQTMSPVCDNTCQVRVIGWWGLLFLGYEQVA